MPTPVPPDGARIAAFLAVSMLAHGILYAAFDRAPVPLTSIGEVVMSVEIVLGSEHAAGLSETPTETEAPDAAASSASRQTQTRNSLEEPPLKNAEQLAKLKPPEVPPKLEEPPFEPKLASLVEISRFPEPKPPVEEKVEEQPSPEQTKSLENPSEETAIAELATAEPKQVEATPAELMAAEMPPHPPEPVRPAASPAKPPEIPLPLPDRSTEAASRAATASAASTSSSGVGRGRSDADSNYRGLVAAHLARHKRFPEEIRRRRQQGSSVVTFAIDGSGKVTNIGLTRSSGNASIDEASQDIIRRASPFPVPPNRQAMSFSVPVSFEIR